jgi:hypothetical protein
LLAAGGRQDRLTLDRQPRRRQVDKVAHEPGRNVGGERDVVAAARVPDEDIARLKDAGDRVAAVGERRPLVAPVPVARQVNGDGLLPQVQQFRNDAFPAPRAVEAAVNQHKPHGNSHHVTRVTAETAVARIRISRRVFVRIR